MPEEATLHDRSLAGHGGSSDDFDYLINIENELYARGVRAAAEGPAALEGIEDGRQIGWNAGAEFSTEWEFYRGFADVLRRWGDVKSRNERIMGARRKEGKAVGARRAS